MPTTKRFHSFTLKFLDNSVEQAFSLDTLKYSRQQGQAAILIGTIVYLLNGIIDTWFVPTDHSTLVWIIRFVALCVPAVVISISFTTLFSKHYNLLLAMVGMAAGVGIIGIQMVLPIDSSSYYYPMMVLVTFYTYNFIGTRFIYALSVDLSLLIAYNVLFGLVLDYPLHILFTHDFFIISANMIGGTAGYLAERQRRLLYLRKQELDDERKYHQTRSLHDGLTGLPNRDLLYDRISQAMAKVQRDGKIHCGYFMDIDGFKSVNDKFSHKEGDRVLRLVAKQLISSVRSIDTVARIGGDEFFVLAMDIGSEEDACLLAQKFLDQINTRTLNLPEEINISLSIGICMFPYEGMSVLDLIHRADKEMYKVKDSGKGYYSMADIS